MPSGSYRETLRRKGFKAFLAAQFLGAASDNIYKLVVSLLAADLAIEDGGGSGYLSTALFVFTVPFLLFSGYAGYVADVFSKRSVLVVTKSLEIVAMTLALLAFLAGHIVLMLAVLFLTAVQSTFFSPAKYGILPEMFRERDLSRANGLLEMSTFLAIIVGTSVGAGMFALWKEELYLIGFSLIAIATLGTLMSLGIPPVPASGAQKAFRINPWAEIAVGARALWHKTGLWVTVLGISYFWFMGALLHMTIILLGKEVMNLSDGAIGLLMAVLGIGIGIGSLTAGKLSGDKVEMGLVPLGAAGVGVSLISASFLPFSFAAVAGLVTLAGWAGGLFIVPLDAYLQQNSGREEKGQLIGSSNFLNMGGIILASASLWFLRDILQVHADGILLALGLLTLVLTFYFIYALPDLHRRLAMWVSSYTGERVRKSERPGVEEPRSHESRADSAESKRLESTVQGQRVRGRGV